MLANGVIQTFDSIPAGSKVAGTFTAAVFDAWVTLGTKVGQVFCDFSTSAMDANFTALQLLGSDDNFATDVVLADFVAGAFTQAYTVTQVQRFRAVVSLNVGAGRRYLKWNVTAGAGTIGITGYGIINATSLGKGPATVAELNVTNSAYIEVL